MAVEFDVAKDEENLEKHGLRLSEFGGFDANPSLIEDRRMDYGEIR